MHLRLLTFYLTLILLTTWLHTSLPGAHPCCQLLRVEALDEEGQRHALGNMFCGALSPFLIGGRPVLPPVTVTLMRRGSVVGGVMRDAHTSASLALFARCVCM